MATGTIPLFHLLPVLLPRTSQLQYVTLDDPYPSPLMYHEASKSIVIRYPYLCDTDVPGGYTFWKLKLVQKFVDYRRKLAPSAKMLEARKQFTNSKSHSRRGPLTSRQSNAMQDNLPCTSGSSPIIPMMSTTQAKRRRCASSSDESVTEIRITSTPKSKRRRCASSSSSDESVAGIPYCLPDRDEDDFEESFENFEPNLGRRFDLKSSIACSEIPLLPTEEAEALRKRTAMLDFNHRDAILKNMASLYLTRIIQCQETLRGVGDELESYPHLTQPYVIFQEALLTFREYEKTPRSDYVRVHGVTVETLPSLVEKTVLNWFSTLKSAVKTNRDAAPYTNLVADTKDIQMKLGLVFMAVRLGVPVKTLFSTSTSVPIVTHNEDPIKGPWSAVAIVDDNSIMSLPVDDTRECLTTFFMAFAAFNLVHPAMLEALIEVVEHQLRFRQRLTKRRAKTVVAGL